jgi:hypothetical protein
MGEKVSHVTRGIRQHFMITTLSNYDITNIFQSKHKKKPYPRHLLLLQSKSNYKRAKYHIWESLFPFPLPQNQCLGLGDT